MENQELFDDIANSLHDELNIDTEEVEFIDMEEIDQLSLEDAIILVDAFTDIDENLLLSQPKLQQKIIQYKDTIRIHLKVLKSGEKIYDILVNNITKSPTNASLYTGLTKLQASMADARIQINNAMASLENCMKVIELEIGFKDGEDKEESAAIRGSRDFIKGLKGEM